MTQFGDEAVVRPSMTIPSCTYLQLHEPWAMTRDQLWSRPSLYSLHSLATNEIEGTRYIETSRSPSTYDRHQPIIEEIRRENTKQFEDNCRGISRFPISRFIPQSTNNDLASRGPRSPNSTVCYPTSQASHQTTDGQKSLSHSGSLAPFIGGTDTRSDLYQFNACESCGSIARILLTPLNGLSSEFSTSSFVSEGPTRHNPPPGHHTSQDRLQPLDMVVGNDTLEESSIDSYPAAKRQKIDCPPTSFTSCVSLYSTPTKSSQPELLEIPLVPASNEFKRRLAELIHQPSSSPPSSWKGKIDGYPPKMSEVIIQGLAAGSTTFSDERTLCYHLNDRSPWDSTCVASLNPLPNLATLSPTRCLSTGTCSILEPLCQQVGRRYPKRSWLHRARQSLRIASLQASPLRPTTGSNINMYRKVLFEHAARCAADPKGDVPGKMSIIFFFKWGSV